MMIRLTTNPMLVSLQLLVSNLRVSDARSLNLPLLLRASLLISLLLNELTPVLGTPELREESRERRLDNCRGGADCTGET